MPHWPRCAGWRGNGRMAWARGNRAGDGASRSGPPDRGAARHRLRGGSRRAAGALARRQASRSCSRRPGPARLLRHWPTAALGVWLVEARRPDETSLTRVSPSVCHARALVGRRARQATTSETRPAGRCARPSPTATSRRCCASRRAACSTCGRRTCRSRWTAGRQLTAALPIARVDGGAAARSRGRSRVCGGVADAAADCRRRRCGSWIRWSCSSAS